MSEGHLEKLDDLIAEAQASGGSERANYQLFVPGFRKADAISEVIIP